MKELGAVFAEHKHGYLLAIMIAKLEEYLDIFYEQDFYDIAISAKSMDAALVIDAYTEISKRFDHPLHLGVTHAGPEGDRHHPLRRRARGCSSTASATPSASPTPTTRSMRSRTGSNFSTASSLRERVGVDLIACPTCGASRSISSRSCRMSARRSRQRSRCR
jgi:(E)-4-hydroxy-3-methylbut-2-enyl-diphosphate synthase